MADADSLATLFRIIPPPDTDTHLSAPAIEAVAKAVAAAALAAGAGSLASVPIAMSKAVVCVADAMTVRVGEILASAWNKRAEIRKYADVAQYPAGQERYVQLYEHPITWTYRPKLEITVRGATFTVPLEVKLALKVDKAVLVIDGGHLLAIEPGTGTIEGTAKIGTFDLGAPIKRDLGELPGRIAFGEGGLPLTPPAIPAS
jgi:hypothetical protein